MGRFIVQLVGFLIGAVIGLALRGSVICDPYVVAPDSAAQRLLDISSEATMQVLVDGGNLVHRCAVASWSFEPGGFGFMLLGWGVPSLFAFLVFPT